MTNSQLWVILEYGGEVEHQVMDLILKTVLGAGVVIVIQLLAKTKYYYIAGLAPLFPTFALISHYVVGTEQTPEALKQTLMFGLASMIPYLVYMLTLYLFVDRLKLELALLCAVLGWSLAATALVLIWNRA